MVPRKPTPPRGDWQEFRQEYASIAVFFTVAVKFGSVSAQKSSMKKDHPNLASAPHKPLILVVEDQEDERVFMTDSLAIDGFTCITAGSVAQAIEVLKTNQVALTILDWGLDRSGAEVLREARALHPHMPVIVVSGRSYDVRTDALVGAADAFLLKPISATVLQCQVRQLLQRVDNTSLGFLPRRVEDIRPIGEIKETYILHALQLLNHNISLAAEKLGVHRQTVGALLKRAGCLPSLDNKV
jgi:DNA-binding response OmpR family regulator